MESSPSLQSHSFFSLPHNQCMLAALKYSGLRNRLHYAWKATATPTDMENPNYSSRLKSTITSKFPESSSRRIEYLFLHVPVLIGPYTFTIPVTLIISSILGFAGSLLSPPNDHLPQRQFLPYPFLKSSTSQEMPSDQENVQ